MRALNEAVPGDPLLHALFERQAARTPGAPALAFEGRRTTYAELDRRASLLSASLCELGVGPGTIVALLVERSPEMVAGPLGVLKAGGAYLPIDPSWPAQRIAFVLEDSGARVLLAHSALAARTPFSGSVLRLDAFDWSGPAGAPPPAAAAPCDLAYVIYTSGSTGRPKGVCVEHRNVVSYVLAAAERFRFAPGMNHAMVSTVAADLGNTVLFPSLATGGCLHVISQERSENGGLLSEYFAREGIDVLKVVPSHLAALQSSREPAGVMPRRILILGGEASRLEWVERLRALAPACEIHNHYGPTEATVGALTYRVGDALPATASGTLPLGTPLANSRIAIVDDSGSPVEPGERGELWIGGEGVARGYLNRPELTAERFVPDPFSPEPGARMYRTGDLARLLPGGDVEFLGRRDDQVKVNGYRVELGEVEEALRAHPGVGEAVVVARDDDGAGKRLVACVVPRRKPQPLWSAASVCLLPDGTSVAHLNKCETEYIYHEIFELQAYLRHGISIAEGDCVVDAGANIGLFTVFASRLAANLRVVAFEPNPAAFACLSLNAAAYGARVKCLPCGLSRANGSAPLTVFQGLSLLSGFHADAAKEGDVVTQYALNVASVAPGEGPAASELRKVVDSRLQPHTETARLRTLSSVIAEEGIDRIDLLKVNVEKSELEVLLGIDEPDWPRIRQVVLEVDLSENVAPITALLERHGYEVVVEQDPLLTNTELCYVYAIRPSASAPRLVPVQAQGAHVLPVPPREDVLTPAGLRRHLKDRLPKYMVPSELALLEKMPLTANGKIDRQALADVRAEERPEPEFVRPQNETEKALAAIWSELLRVERVSVNDDFFELGGHSLLAIKAVSRIRDVFGVDLKTDTLFETPTIAGLVGVLLAARGSREASRAIPRRAARGTAPLSFQQEPLWFLDRLAPGAPVYNIVDVFPVPGPYDGDAMRNALRELVRRHEALRTVFSESRGEPLQVVLPHVDPSLADVDLRALGAEQRERAWTHVVREEGARPFVLSEPPLLRATAVHLSDSEHRLLLVVHHIVADEWSMEIVQQELAELYAAFSRGETPQLRELPIQYADFAAWQREWLRGDELRRQSAWWEEELAGAPTVLEIPTDRPRPAVQSFRGALESFSLPEELLDRAKVLARQEQATLFMLLESAFALLLHRTAGQPEILVGTPITGRTRSETERMVGCFINTVILRARFPHGLTGRELLRQTRERAMGAYAHPDLPFEHLVDALAPERDPGRTPLFQAMFVLHDAGGVSRVSKVSGNRELGTATSKVDLTLFFAEEDGRLEGMVEYATDLFEPETIRRFCGHYETLLSALLRDPDRSVGTLPMLTGAERRALRDANATAAPIPEARVDELVSAAAARAPERVAVVSGALSWTYAELERRAERLARRLRASGVAPGVRVAVFLERSPEMLAALLAVAKAGGAWVPLDPAFPAERLAYMLEDSGAALVLTHAPTAAAAPSFAPALRVDEEEGEEAIVPEGAPRNAGPGDLAYVIYTSGSTGKPKGVAVTHRSLVNLLASMGREPGLSADDVLLSVTTLSFDIAALELFLPLIAGARVVLAGREDVLDGARLAGLLRSGGASVMQATPTTWRMLVESGWEGTPGLKVLCGGEALARDLADALLPRAGEVWNVYGPTETTIWSSLCRVAPGTGPVPIGRPVANTQLWVLDAHNQPLPSGVPGELWIGGAGVAQGYWNRPELTAERFVRDPFSAEPGARLYRTGDRARVLPDGSLECLGRVDMQVKVRGFRIEPGEIEACLRERPGIADAAVVAQDSPGGERRLVGWVVRAPGAPDGAADLRGHLASRLPSYMIPSALVFLDALPTTPNGKVDRQALARRPAGAEPPAAPRALPRTRTEEAVASIWRDVLGAEAADVHENFFDAGGNSLSAVRIVSRVRTVFGVDISLRRLFQGPTIAELAETLEALASTPRARSA